MGSYISYLFVNPEDLPNNPGGFVQLLFLMACYAFFLYQGSQLISNGSELLLLVPAVAGVVGSVVLPVLGAVPDGAIVLFSGLGADAQNQLNVGVGALAGSTVMLLTLPWALCIFAGRVDLDPSTGMPVYRKPKGAGEGWTKLTPGLGWRHALFGSGIPMMRPMKINALILALTSLAYLLIQLPAFGVGCGKGQDCKDGATREKWWALAGFLFATISFVLYLVYQLRVGGDEEYNQERITEMIADKITEGHVGVADAFFAFCAEEKAAQHAEREAGGLLRNEASSPAIAVRTPSVLGRDASEVSVTVAADGSSTALVAGHSDASRATAHKIRSILKRFFKKYDRDGNGFMDVSELGQLLKDIGQRMSPEAVRGLFASMDASGDAKVDFEEFSQSMLLILQHPNLAQQLEEREKAKEKEQAEALKAAAASSSPVIGTSIAVADGRPVTRRGKSIANLNAVLAGIATPAGPFTPQYTFPAGSYGSTVGVAGNGASSSSAAVSSHASASPPDSNSLNRVPFTGSALNLRAMPGSPAIPESTSEGSMLGVAHHVGEDSDDEVEEEEDEMPEDLASLDPEAQQRAIKFRAMWMMGLGTALILLFSDPMVDCLSQLGDRTHIPVFYVSFLLAPLAANASELLAAVNYAAKKTPASITISLTSLEGSAAMNNTFCLLIFLMLVFAKDLVWEFSAETIAILVVEVVAACLTLKKVHRGIDAIFLLALYPLSMGLVAILENGVGLN